MEDINFVRKVTPAEYHDRAHKLSEDKISRITKSYNRNKQSCSLASIERQFKILFEKSSGLIKRPISIEILGNGEIVRRNIDGSTNMTIKRGTKSN